MCSLLSPSTLEDKEIIQKTDFVIKQLLKKTLKNNNKFFDYVISIALHCNLSRVVL